MLSTIEMIMTWSKDDKKHHRSPRPASSTISFSHPSPIECSVPDISPVIAIKDCQLPHNDTFCPNAIFGQKWTQKGGQLEMVLNNFKDIQLPPFCSTFLFYFNRANWAYNATYISVYDMMSERGNSVKIEQVKGRMRSGRDHYLAHSFVRKVYALESASHNHRNTSFLGPWKYFRNLAVLFECIFISSLIHVVHWLLFTSASAFVLPSFNNIQRYNKSNKNNNNGSNIQSKSTHLVKKKSYFRRLPSDFPIISTDICAPRSASWTSCHHPASLTAADFLPRQWKWKYAIIEQREISYWWLYNEPKNSQNNEETYKTMSDRSKRKCNPNQTIRW